MRNLKEIDVNTKRVLVREDLNVPTDKKGGIVDDSKIRAALPTLQYLVENGARVVIASHLGRPKGKPDERYSLKPVAERLSRLLGRRVGMAPDCVGPEVLQMVDKTGPGDVVLLENVRFHAEEEKNDPAFARQLAELADLYVNDAFGTAHRAHASTAGVAEYLPAVPGFLLEKEATMLRRVLDRSESPRMTIMGGAKVSDKLGLLENMLDKMDVIIIGGGMANTFLKAGGIYIGNSLCEDSLVDKARELTRRAQEKQVRLMLPVDVVAAEKIAEDASYRTVPVDKVPEGWSIVDIGPETADIFAEAIKEARTVFWNGPMGVFEISHFMTGTNEVAKAVAASGAVSVVGGGDSLAAIAKLGLEEQITHLSTGGGATLEFLEGKTLPGLVSCNCLGMAV